MKTPEERLQDPVFRQACCELYASALFCFESDKDSVNAVGTCMLFRIGELLFGDAELKECTDEELVEVGRKAFHVPRN
jgi:hypothetical protein